MKHRCLRSQRGSVLIFTIALTVFLLVMGGLAIDLTFLGASKAELQRSLDAASLAGAGNLGFDDTVFPDARQAAQDYAAFNQIRGDPNPQTVNLNLNAANNPSGDIVLGIWAPDPTGAVTGNVCVASPVEYNSCAATDCFTPSVDGTRVNAVCTQYATQIPTSFLRLLGRNSLDVSARAIAVANPPVTVDEGSCIFPIALNGCTFDSASSTGCGDPITMISSSGTLQAQPPPGTNSAAWANVCDTGNPTPPTTIAAIEAAAGGGSCSQTCDPPVLDDPEDPPTIGTNNGMQQVTFDVLEASYVPIYDNSVSVCNSGGNEEELEEAGCPTVRDSDGNVTYQGPGWEVMVPVVDTGGNCPVQAFNGALPLLGWAKFVMAQVVNHGDCVVDNGYDDGVYHPWDWYCDPPLDEPAYRAVFGYFSCQVIPAPPTPLPAVRTAISDRLRLVQ